MILVILGRWRRRPSTHSHKIIVPDYHCPSTNTALDVATEACPAGGISTVAAVAIRISGQRRHKSPSAMAAIFSVEPVRMTVTVA